MKLLYLVPSIGACALMLLSSCRSSRNADAYANAETAIPLSEMADDELPPWIMHDDGSYGDQVSAGDYTPVASNRNLYPIPEPGETPTGGSRQNQPHIAGSDNVTVEQPGEIIDPLTNKPVDADILNPPAKPPVKPTKSGNKGTSTTGKKTLQPTRPTLIVYKVRPGDNLSVIATRSNTTVSQIMRDSNLKSTTIHPGQKIKVLYTPNGYKGSKNAGKGTKNSGKGTKSSGKTHTVTAGQTLSGIAAKYGVSTSKLMKLNGISAAGAKKIRPGQVLKIPAKG